MGSVTMKPPIFAEGAEVEVKPLSSSDRDYVLGTVVSRAIGGRLDSPVIWLYDVEVAGRTLEDIPERRLRNPQ